MVNKNDFLSMESEIKMMRNPNVWPRWPVLPVVNRNEPGWPECGIMINECKPIVYLIGMFELKAGVLSESLKDVKKAEFQTYEALIQAGWEVD